jgi:hypothetical protein
MFVLCKGTRLGAPETHSFVPCFNVRFVSLNYFSELRVYNSSSKYLIRLVHAVEVTGSKRADLEMYSYKTQVGDWFHVFLF